MYYVFKALKVHFKQQLGLILATKLPVSVNQETP